MGTACIASRKLSTQSFQRTQTKAPGHHGVFSTKQKPMRIINMLLIAVGLVAVACGEEKAAKDTAKKASGVADADRVKFTRRGPSVPPPYHRSYAITAGPEKLTIEVSDYEKTLLKEERPFSAKEFENLLRSFRSLTKKADPKSGDRPVGGSINGIVFFRNGRPIFEGMDYGGAAKNYAGGEIDISYLVPDLEALIEKTKGEAANKN